MNAVYLPGTFADTITAYINRAKYSIDIAMYNFTANNFSGTKKIADAVNAAMQRGVQVRWIYNGTTATNNTGLTLLNTAVKTLASPNYTDYIMHNKFMVMDVNSADSNDAIIQTGSYNWSDQQGNSDYNNIIFIQSKQVALAYHNEFNKMWGSNTGNPDINTAAFSIYKTVSAQNIFNVNGTTVEVYFSPKDNIGSHLKDMISTAGNDLFFGIYTFTDNSIANQLKDKYNAGVNTRGIADKFSIPFAAYNTLNPVLGSNMLVFNGSFTYHNKVMLADALTPSSDPQVFTGSFNWSIQAQNSNDENAIIIHDASVANQYYQALCRDFTELGGIPCVAPPCPGGNSIFVSSAKGSSYQWQVNTGNGFSNIADNANYSGSTSANLTLINPPANWYGYTYRCFADGNKYSDTTTLKFTAYWNGSTSSDWFNTANWNCGVLPHSNTDVIINAGVTYFPLINSNTTCRSVTLNKNTVAAILSGVQLILSGPQ